MYFLSIYSLLRNLVNIRNVEGDTSSFVSSLTNGYDRPGYVPVPTPDLTSTLDVEENNFGGNVPVPTPDPSSFPTGKHPV